MKAPKRLKNIVTPPPEVEAAAKQFITQAICEWGQDTANRIEAVQAVLTVAGFKARATCYPIFGGIWNQACEGIDGVLAADWLKHLTETMQRGKYEWEVEHVVACILRARQLRL